MLEFGLDIYMWCSFTMINCPMCGVQYVQEVPISPGQDIHHILTKCLLGQIDQGRAISVHGSLYHVYDS